MRAVPVAVVLCVTSLAASCGDDGVLTVVDAGHDGDGKGDAPERYVTVLNRTSVLAGEEVMAFCFVDDHGTRRSPKEPITLDVVPAIVSVEVRGNIASFTPTLVGDYRLRCRAADRGDVAGDTVGAEVLPGLPFAWTVRLEERACYEQFTRLPLEITVEDAYGNPIDDADIAVAAAPSRGVASIVGDEVRFREPGRYELTVALRGRVAPGATIAPFVALLLVDSTPPQLALDNVARGAMLQGGNYDEVFVEVTGTAADATSDVVALSVEGQDFALGGPAPMQPFSTLVVSRYGLTIVQGRAVDGCGNVGALAQSFLRSPDYAEASLQPSPGAVSADAGVVHLTQTLVDDGDRADADDLATVAERMLLAQDLEILMPPGAALGGELLRDDCGECGFGNTFFDTGYAVRRDPDPTRLIGVSGPFVDGIAFVGGGLRMVAHLDSLAMPVELNARSVQCVAGCDLDESLTVTGVVRATRITVVATMAAANGAIDMRTVDVQLEGPDVDVDCGALSGLCSSIAGLVAASVADSVAESVEETIRDTVMPAISGMLASMATPTAVALEAPIGVTVNFVGALDTLEFCGADVGLPAPPACAARPGEAYGTIGIAAQAFPSSAGSSAPGGARGPIRQLAPLPRFGGSAGLSVAVADDALNQLLWAVWYGGGFDLDDLDLAGELAAGVSLRAKALLPPVIMPGYHGSDIDLGVGDLYVAATVDMAELLGVPVDGDGIVDVELYLSFTVGAAVDIDPITTTLSLRVAPVSEVAAQVLAINDSHHVGELSEALGAIVADALAALASNVVAGAPIPSVSLDSLPGLAGEAWTVTSPSLTHGGGYIVLDGGVTN